MGKGAFWIFRAVYGHTAPFLLMIVSLIGIFSANILDRYGLASSFVYGGFMISPAQQSSRIISGGGRLAVDALWDGQGGPGEFDFFEDVDYPIIEDDSLTFELAPVVPEAIFTEDLPEKKEILRYVVEEGDTLSAIAVKFGVSVTTLLWNNNMSSGDYIKIGQELEILPIDGIKYTVKSGDTVSGLAKKFSAEENQIIAYNQLSQDGSLNVGDILILPDGKLPLVPAKTSYARSGSGASGQKAGSAAASAKYYAFPTVGRISQGRHGYNGVDIANQCGAPIYAAAEGYITGVSLTSSRSRLGASVFYGYGNHVKVSHPNGTVTLYAHLKEVLVVQGQQVNQGDAIGYMGGGFENVNGKVVRMEGAGKSTGCHLHFEVRGGRNPYLR